MPEEQKNDATPAPSTTPAEAGAQTPEKSPEEKCAEHELNWKRALADYQNLQKEVARDRAEMGSYAMLRAVERFLPIFDNLNVAMQHKPSGVSGQVSGVAQWAVGIGYIQKQIEDALRDLGLTAIKTVGEPFDAARHEAVGEEKSGVSGQVSGVVFQEVQAGYEMNGKVVRPAKVIVNK